MKKTLLTIAILLILSFSLSANELDSIQHINLDDIYVLSNKETNVTNVPVSTVVLSNDKIEQADIRSVRDISGIVPNFYIPDYGSSMSSAPYVRGVGSRYSGQSISLYVDNVPYMEKSAFDFEFYDVGRIEVLSGSQGSLYGRNAMSGHVNVFTLSPLQYQGIKASISGGNYGYLDGKASFYTKLNSNLGVSISGYYRKHDGFYQNDFTGKSVDAEKSLGARAKVAWSASQTFKLEYVADYNNIDQGAFPYGLYNPTTSTIANPNFNGLSNYERNTVNNSLFIQSIHENIVTTASISHQYFKDEMNMDQDYSPLPIFSIQQKQKQNLLNGEVVLKSLSADNYRWLLGANLYAQKLDMYAPVTFENDGINMILQPIFTGFNINIVDSTFAIPGWYDTSRSGGSFFHQSTFENLLTEGLSLTLGLRLDVDNVKLDYNSTATLNTVMKQGPVTIPILMSTDLSGVVDTSFVELLPRMALKYEWKRNGYVYANVSRGYKSGGFNVQMISDILSQKFMNARNTDAEEPNVKQNIMYKPEHSWNYEVGINNSFINEAVNVGVTLFYMTIEDLQLTEFLATGAGRKLTNAGTSASKGVELKSSVYLGCGFDFSLNYGYAHAVFKQYKDISTVNGKDIEVDYSGKFVPYAPQHTLNAMLNYNRKFENGFISELYGTVSHKGIGKIYWNESNHVYEDFYNLLDARLGVKKGIFAVELWGKNLLNTDYNVFYFDVSFYQSTQNAYYQKGKPMQIGARVSIEI